jgi:hypothetical protein
VPRLGAAGYYRSQPRLAVPAGRSIQSLDAKCEPKRVFDLSDRAKIVPDADSRQLILDLFAASLGILVALLPAIAGDLFLGNSRIVYWLVIAGLGLAARLLARFKLIRLTHHVSLATDSAFGLSATVLLVVVGFSWLRGVGV